MKKIKQGDILYTSWGYDQTNYDYIMVIRLSPTGKTAICKRVAHQHMGHSGQCNIQKPVPVPFGAEFRLQVRYHEGYNNDEETLIGSYPFLSNFHDDWPQEQKDHWFESKRRGYFSLAKKDQTFYETDSMFGH